MFRTAPLAALAGFAAASASFAATINVPADFPLSIAIAVAQDGDEIVISPTGSPYLVFPGLEFADKTLTLRGATGDPADVVIDAAELDVVLTITGAGAAGTRLEALTISGGREAGPSSPIGAGLVLLNAGDVTIHNCIIEDNRSVVPNAQGVGIYSDSTDVTMTDTIVRNNSASNDTADGIGAYFTNSDVVITNSRFEQNDGLDANGLPIPFTASAFGGAIFFQRGFINLTRTVVDDNRSGRGAGAYFGFNATTTIDACTFQDNTAADLGGAVVIDGNSVSSAIRNSVFVGNEALGSRGGALIADAPTNVDNCTFVGNESPSNIIASVASSLNLDNSIVWGNEAPAMVSALPAPGPLVRNSIVTGGYPAPGRSINVLNVDPLFTDQAGRDFTLSPNSPAIDSGDSVLYLGPFLDLAGNPRGQDDPNTADTGFAFDGPIIDRGAFEFTPNPTTPCPGDTSGDNQVDGADLLDVINNFGNTCP